ncbi:MAG: hypothetical protein IJW62_00945 [Clostridia bacterium]|nr:hypothetical protein [Clostridia bacterium]
MTMTQAEIRHTLSNTWTTIGKMTDGAQIRVMSNNMLGAGDPQSRGADLHYTERLNILCEYYLFFQPDFLGGQECGATMIAAMPEEFFSVYAQAPVEEGVKNRTPVFYRKDLWEVEDSRFHKLTVDDPWLDHCWSYYWALFRNKKDPSSRYIHMNLHYHYKTAESRMPGVLEVRAELARLMEVYPGVPISISGDYNFRCPGVEYTAMTEGLNMHTAILIAEQGGDVAYSCHPIDHMGSWKNPAVIDHISVTADTVAVKRFTKIEDEVICKASDHYPIFIDIALK